MLFPIWPRETPKNNTIKENSDICAKQVPAKKFVLLVYPNKAEKAITTVGFKDKTIAENINDGMIIDFIFEKSALNPNIKKNITKKKSLSGLILELISGL